MLIKYFKPLISQLFKSKLSEYHNEYNFWKPNSFNSLVLAYNESKPITTTTTLLYRIINTSDNVKDFYLFVKTNKILVIKKSLAFYWNSVHIIHVHTLFFKPTLLNEIENFVDIILHFHWFHYLFNRVFKCHHYCFKIQTTANRVAFHFYFISYS